VASTENDDIALQELVYSVLIHPCTMEAVVDHKKGGEHGPKHEDERVRNVNTRGRQLRPTKQAVNTIEM
jgi:hypothetical protein